MLKKIIIIYFIFLSTLFSNTIEIKDSNKINTINKIYYLQDNKNTFSYKDIIDNKNLSLLKKHHIGPALGPFWTKVSIQNKTNEILPITFYNDLAGINKIDVYILKNKKLVDMILLGDLRKQDLRMLKGRYSNFNLILEPNETYTIISKIKNYHIYNLGWEIIKSEEYFNQEAKKIFYSGLVGGFILLFCFYNLFKYFVYKNQEYLAICGIAIFIVAYQYGFHGIFYMLDLDINLELITAITWNASVFGGFFILQFAYYFFNLKDKFRKLSYLTNFFSLAYFSLFFLLLYAQFYNEEYFKYSIFLVLVVLSSTIYLFILSIYMFIRKEVGSIYYLIGQGTLLIGVFLNTLGLFNMITYQEFIKFAIPLSYIIDLFSMLIAISVKNQRDRENLKKVKLLMVEQSRFNSIGQAVGHVSHQWKNPLTRIGTSLTLLETIYNHNQEKLTKSFEKQLPLMKKSLNLMKKSIDEFSTFYKTKKLKENFSPYESINNVVEILNSKMILKKVNLTLIINKELRIYGFEHILSNVFMILIDNSLDEFTDTEENNIKITINKEKYNIIINYIDNAGGIKITPIESIFDYFISTKMHSKDNSGIGLAIVKMLITERLNGEIYVKNVNNGVQFTIILPDNKNEEQYDK